MDLYLTKPCSLPDSVRKLPKWAQDLIEKLNRERNEAAQALSDFTNTQSQSCVWVGNEYDGAGRKYIQTDRVTFQIANGTIAIRIDGNALDLNGNFGSARMTVQPWSSNVVKIRIEERE